MINFSKVVMSRAKLLVLILAMLFSAGCRVMPDARWARLQDLRDDLLEEQADIYVPLRGARFLNEFENIRVEYEKLSRENGMVRTSRARFSSRLAALERRLNNAIMSGETLLADTRQHKKELRHLQTRRIREAANFLRGLETLPSAPRVQEMISRVEITLNTASQLWEASQHAEVSNLLNDLELLGSDLQGNVEEIRGRFQDSKLLRRWQQWALATVEWSRLHRKPALVVDKYNRWVLVYERGNLVEKLPVDLGWSPWGDKTRQGDGATPEGKYTVEKMKGSGETNYYLALLLDYPNDSDRMTFSSLKRNGELSQQARLGSLIEIHGEGGKGMDWTDGCVALDNPSMKRLFETSYPGMPVTIVGTVRP